MGQEIESKLRKAYPKLWSENSPRGVECDVGWEKILFDASEEAFQILGKNSEVYIFYAKEKFGGLDIAFSHYPKTVSNQLWEIADRARKRSLETCENCGSPGKIRKTSYWIKTRCDSCEEATQNKNK